MPTMGTGLFKRPAQANKGMIGIFGIIRVREKITSHFLRESLVGVVQTDNQFRVVLLL